MQIRGKNHIAACCLLIMLAFMGLPLVMSAMPQPRIINVPAGGDLQAVINSAQPGDRIVLEAGAEYDAPDPSTGEAILLVSKPASTTWITITSSQAHLLPEGRVSPANSAHMTKIVALGPQGAFETRANSQRWKLVGLEITNRGANFVPTLVNIGGHTGVSDIWLDRCYVHPQEDGTSNIYRTVARGISVSSPPGNGVIVTARIRITRSHISGFGGFYPNSTEVIPGQGIASNILDGLTLEDNYVAGAYQSWFPGGGDPTNVKSGIVQHLPVPTMTSARLSSVVGLAVGDYVAVTQPVGANNPARHAQARVTAITGNDVTHTRLHRPFDAPAVPAAGGLYTWGGETGRNYVVTHNTFAIDRPLAQAVYDTTKSNPKYYVEFKMGENVLLEGNTFEGWPTGVGFQATNQTGATPWVTVSNVVFRNNWMKDFSASLIVSGGNPAEIESKEGHLTAESENILIENNLFTQSVPGTQGKVAVWGGGDGVVWRHNTWALGNFDGNTIALTWRIKNFVMEDNILSLSRYPFICSGVANFKDCLPGWVERKNALVNNLGLSPDSELQAIFPNSYVSSAQNGPVVWTGANPESLLTWVLAAGPYKAGGARQASDGADMGVSITKLAPTPTPTPSVVIEFIDVVIPPANQIDALFTQMGNDGYNQVWAPAQSSRLYFGRVKGTTVKYEWRHWPFVNGINERRALAKKIGDLGYGNVLVWSGIVRASREK